MWIPKTIDELEHGVKSGGLEEGPSFDAKRELPSNNMEIAKDIAAMANDGGVLIYGIAEDEKKRPTILSPIQLVGQRERVTLIARTAISEPLNPIVAAIPTEADNRIGYLVVVIPPSERAPHMVVVKGENRYYGRTSTGNTPLIEAEIARLYERRRAAEISRDELLSKEIENMPYQSYETLGYLHLFSKPALAGENLIQQAVKENSSLQSLLHSLIQQVREMRTYPTGYYPSFDLPQAWVRFPDGLLGRMSGNGQTEQAGSALELRLNFDGFARLFCGRAAETEQNAKLFFPSVVYGNTVHFLLLMGKLYSQASFIGVVDIGLAVTGIRDSVPFLDSNPYIRASFPRFEGHSYKKTARVSALELAENPKQIAEEILKPLFDTFTQGRIGLFPKV